MPGDRRRLDNAIHGCCSIGLSACNRCDSLTSVTPKFTQIYSDRSLTTYVDHGSGQYDVRAEGTLRIKAMLSAEVSLCQGHGQRSMWILLQRENEDALVRNTSLETQSVPQVAFVPSLDWSPVKRMLKHPLPRWKITVKGENNPDQKEGRGWFIF